VARAARHNHSLSVAILDVDHFKSIDDQRGHRAGDSVLHELGERLGTILREGELVARVDGVESYGSSTQRALKHWPPSTARVTYRRPAEVPVRR
jgi:diguanylate cyclase (GGDEF)-like protein